MVCLALGMTSAYPLIGFSHDSNQQIQDNQGHDNFKYHEHESGNIWFLIVSKFLQIKISQHIGKQRHKADEYIVE